MKTKTNKITWEVIFQEFKSRYPKLSKSVSHWNPYNYAEILITLKDNTKLIYNYDEKVPHTI